MGSTTSHTDTPSIVKDLERSHIPLQSSQFAKSKVPRMALAFDSQIHQDDLGHDTLMGLQELDSHLAIFEETAAPASLSDGSSDDFQDATDMTLSNHSQEAERNNFKPKPETVAIPRNIIEANGTSKYASPVILYLAIEGPSDFIKPQPTYY
jgi:hypothetical protein